MLSVEEQIIDATTDEGKAAFKELEEQAKADKQGAVQVSEDPE